MILRQYCKYKPRFYHEKSLKDINFLISIPIPDILIGQKAGGAARS